MQPGMLGIPNSSHRRAHLSSSSPLRCEFFLSDVSDGGMSSAKIMVVVLCFCVFFLRGFFSFCSLIFFCELQISPFLSKSFLASEACCQKSHLKIPSAQVPPGEKSHAELCGRIQFLGCKDKRTSWFRLALLAAPRFAHKRGSPVFGPWLGDFAGCLVKNSF